MKTRRIDSTALPALVVLAVFGVYLSMLSLNVPLFADDLCRARHDVDFIRAVKAAWHSYLDWSGRLPVMLLNHLFFSGDGTGVVVLAVINGVFCVAAGALMLRWFGPGTAGGNLCWTVIFLGLFWFATRSLGEAVLWKTGSIQFFWGVIASSVCLGAMARATFTGPTIVASRVSGASFVIVCLLGGMWLEHLSVAVVVVGAGLLLVNHILGSTPWPRMLRYGYAAWVLGTLALVAAPGNYARIEAVGRVEPLAARIVGITSYLLLHLDALILLTVIAFLCIALINRPAGYHRQALVALTFFSAGVIAAYATLGAPVMVFTGRVAFVSQWMFILAALALFPATPFTPWSRGSLRRVRHGLFGLSALVAAAIVFDARNVYRVYEDVARQERARQELIAAALERGEDAVQLPPLYFSKRLHTRGREINKGRYFARDITIDSDHFTNQCYARYHGLRKVAL